MSVTDSTATAPSGVALRGPRARPTREPRASLATAPRMAWTALLVLIACSAAAVVCSEHTPTLSPDSIQLAVPPALAGPLGGLGPDIHLGGMIALFVVMGLSYGVLVRLGSELPARAIIGAVIAVHVLMALAPTLLSTDVFSYGEYGRMSALYHYNPYVYGPDAVRGTDLLWYPFIGSPWVSTPTAYGPLFTALSFLLAHLSLATAMLAYKLMTVAASLAAIAGAAVGARRLGLDPVRATLFIGLNPVLIIYAVGGAHNDMLMLAALVWALVALVGHRARTAGGLLVVAMAVKLTAAILLPFALAARRETARPHQGRVLAGAVLVLLGVGIVSTVLFGSGPLHLLSTLEVIQANGGKQSVPGFIAWGLGLGRLSHGVVIGLQAGLVVTFVALLVAVRRQRIDWITATGWAIVALLLTSTFLLPWYIVWLLPFAALSPSRSLRTASLALTAVGMTSL